MLPIEVTEGVLDALPQRGPDAVIFASSMLLGPAIAEGCQCEHDMGPVIPLVAATIAGPTMLLGWSLIYPLGCWSMLLPAIVAAVLTLARRDRLAWRRRCLADCLFAGGSPLHRLLRSRFLITLAAAGVALMLTGVLIITIPRWDFTILAIIALDGLLITALFAWLHRLSGGRLGVNPAHRTLFARVWTVRINVLTMLPLLMLVQLQQPPPDYLDRDGHLRATLQDASASVTSECVPVDTLVRLGREGEAFAWWAILKATQAIEQRLLRWIAWLVFLLSGSLSLWAYSSFCVQLVHYARWRKEAA